MIPIHVVQASMKGQGLYQTDRTYPSYCSTPDQMEATRHIPPLYSSNTNTPLYENVDKFTLLHVTTVIRHGARTPYAPHQCWSNYDDHNVDTSSWECTLTSMMNPQSEDAISLEYLEPGEVETIQNEEYSETAQSGKGLFFLYQKKYDANWSEEYPDHYPDNMVNDLRGNCQRGQLILKGHAQQLTNGKILQKAYVKYSAINLDEPKVGTLFDFDEEELKTIVKQRAYDEPSLYFRSDDDERTLISGQILLRQFFGDLMKEHQQHYKDEGKDQDRPVIRVHTADRDKDVLAPNPDICPRLNELEEEAKASRDYQEKFVESEEAKIMKQLGDDELGGYWMMEDPGVAIDCVMTTSCADKTLPYVLDVDKSKNDADLIEKYGPDIFQRFVDFNIEKFSYVFTYKSGKYSRIATNPLWNEILAGLLIHTGADKYEMHKAWPDIRPESKFALYSAHDTTIMTLLASLGYNVYDGSDWPPYASMINIELYDIEYKTDADDNIQFLNPTGIGFRLIYNGDVITNRISGCGKIEEICDLDILVLHVYSFSDITEWDEQCTPLKNDDTGINGYSAVDKNKIGGLVLLYLIGGLLCGFVGAFIMFLYLSKKFDYISSNGNKHVCEDTLQLTTSRNQVSNVEGKVYGLPVPIDERDFI